MSNTLFKLKRSAVKGKAPTTSSIELGELAINTNDGRLFFKTTDSASSSAIQTLREITASTGITVSQGAVSITNTGVTADTVGSSTRIPIITVNAQGQITALDSAAVAGVSTFTFDSASATLNISTADGGSFNARIGLSSFSTSDLSEGTNLYYTTVRADSAFDDRLALKTTDNLSEGVVNKYYLSSRFDSDLATKTTDDLAIGSVNLYYDSDRTIETARHALSATGSITYDATTGVLGYSEQSYGGFDSDFGQKTTTNLTEGTNLYFTTARARNVLSVQNPSGDGTLAYDSATGVLTYTGPSASETRAHFSGGTGVTITDGVVAIAQSVGTTDDVVFGKVTVDSAQVDCLHLTKLPEAPNSLRGLLYYDSDPQSGLTFIPTTNELVEDVRVNLGQEHLIYVHNLTGAQINNGDAVYISGTAHGFHPQVTLARANVSTTAMPSGVATMNIPNGNHGYITKFGLVRGLNTSGMIAGAFAYLSADSAGKWSTAEVSVDSGYPTHLGRVISVDSVEGSLLVDIQQEHFEYLRVQDKVIIGEDLVVPDIYTSHFHMDGKAPGYYAEGMIYYDSATGALVVKNDEQEITLQVGQQELIRVYNNTGSDISNGTPVYIGGTANNLPSILPADATFAFGSVGIATHTIENGSVGYVTARGIVNNVNTQGISEGSKIHVGVGGGLTGTSPVYPYYPTDMGVCLVQDSAVGKIYVDIIDHTMETLRVTEDARFDANVTIGGNLNILGVTTSVISQSLTTSGNLLQLLDGDTVGTAYQSSGGLNDATFKGKYLGDSDVFYFVRMVSVDSAGVGDTIEWGVSDSDAMSYGSFVGLYGYGAGFDSAGGQTTWNLKTDGLTAPLRNGLSIQFINLSGHDSADVWCAHPTELNLDLGVIGNYNQASEPLKYAGIVRDATDERWKFFDGYPAANIDSSGAQFDINFDSASLADIQFATAHGNLSGNATTASTATQLATARTIGLTGNVTAAGVSFNGTSNITLTTSIANDTITNAMINASANIADTKLATISTSGKVQNSATTATSSNTGSTIVARDGSGNFTAGTITANLTGDVTGTVSSLSNHTSTIRGVMVAGSGIAYDSASGVISTIETYSTSSQLMTAIKTVDSNGSGLNADTLDGQQGTYYRINVYNSSGSLLN